MTTANLHILDDHDPDKTNNYAFFVEKLSAWATQYVSEISCPVARFAEDLFEVQAVRVLLDKWYDAYRANKAHQRDAFSGIAFGKTEDATPEELESYYATEQHAYNTALYTLIVE